MTTAQTTGRLIARVLLVDSGSAQVWEVCYGEILRVGAAGELAELGGADALIIGGRQREVPEFFRSLPHELRVRVVGSFTADPATVSLAEIRGNVAFILRHRESAGASLATPAPRRAG